MRKSVSVLFTTVLIALCGTGSLTPAQVFAASEPDYSHVSDFLDGRRNIYTLNDVIIGGLVLPTSDGTKIDENKIYTLPAFSPKDAGPEISARMFNSTIDTVVYTNGDTIFAVDPVSKRTASFKWAGQDLRNALITAGDFRGDGYSEAVLVTVNGSRIIAAKNPNNFSEGLVAGDVTRPSSGFPDAKPVAVAAGDIRGGIDGHRYVVFIYNTQTIPSGRRKAVLDYSAVDPKLLRITGAGGFKNLTEPRADFAIKATVAVGKFGTTLRDQIAVAYYTTRADGSNPSNVSIKAFDTERYLEQTLTLDQPGGELVLRTSRFNPTSPLDQAAMKWNLGRGNVRLGILSFDSELKMRPPEFATAPVACSTPGLSVGNFSRTEPVPQDPSKTQVSFKLQLAIQTDNCSSRDMGLNIFNVDPPNSPSGNFTVDATPAFTQTTNEPTWLQYVGMPIVASDVQGRSYLLGDPSKVVIEDTDQPSVVAAMPPMHVDFITPVGMDNPIVLNLSAIPDGFHTLYETTSSEEKESTTTNTTSWSFGAEQKISTEVEIGDVEEGFGAKAGLAVRAAQDLKGLSEEEHGSYDANKFSVHLQTGFSDHIWFTSTRFNIYVYPVIGRTVCPATMTDCDDSNAKAPLTIEYSAPDFSSYEHIDGALLPWYQPPWEPGNVLSYPATYRQLQQMMPAIDKLSADHTWRTDGSTLTEETSWTKEETDGTSASLDQNYSFDTSLSAVAACCGRLVTGTVSAELNLSGSTGFTTLNKAVAKIGKSTGIGIKKPGTFLSPGNYNYAVTPFIFGQLKPPNLVDKVPLEGDVDTAGILRTAFVANPTARNSGSWWTSAYSSAPDVALNRPMRWQIESLGLENPIPPQCRQVGTKESTMNCAVRSPAFPNKPWDSLFHIMRGFFISSASHPGEGPQRMTARAGEKLTLQTRVYNYSLATMPSGTEVHVRFYVQPVDNFKVPVGSSRLINDKDVIVPAVPPFSDVPGAPVNWTLASTTFDTTGYGNQYLTFWVVVWMQSPDGRLLREIQGHGLKQIPGTLNSLADVETEEYSNNLGFYNSEFYVFARSAAAADVSADEEPATIDMDRIEVSNSRPAMGRVAQVSTLLNAVSHSASGVTAIFYDGDPDTGGVPFGVERAPYIAENDLYKIEAPYFAKTCGKHDIFVAVHEGTTNELMRKAHLTVDCRPVH